MPNPSEVVQTQRRARGSGSSAPSEEVSHQGVALFDIYKTYVTTAEGVSDRRGRTNTFFLTANSTLVAVGSFALNLQKNAVAALIISAAGIVLCISWQRLIESYRTLNTAKFAVITELEKVLCASPFTDEWRVLENKQEDRYYVRLSKIEQTVPWVFVALYGTIAVIYVGTTIL